MKEKSKTGFRNGDLFCFNCGRSYKMPLPQPLTMAAALFKQFDEDHKNCQPSWKEPVNETALDKTEVENANWWAVSGEHGTSSMVMFNKLSTPLNIRRMPIIGWNTMQHPSDPDDFSRCYKLLQAVPQWKLKLNELKPISPVWEKLVDNWDKLTSMYEQNVREKWINYETIGMYEFMESLTNP